MSTTLTAGTNAAAGTFASAGLGASGASGATAGGALPGAGASGASGTGAAGVAGGASAAGAVGMAGASGAAGTLGAANAGASAGMGSSAMLRASISALGVAQGSEAHVCVVVELDNEQEAWVDSIHASLTDGSHHLIVDRRAADTELQLEPITCGPTVGDNATRVLIAQQHDTRIELPPGVAMRLEPRQKLFLQLHYINLGSVPIDVVGTVALRLFDSSQGPPIEVRSIFTGATNILLPSGEAGMVESEVPPSGLQDGPVTVFALTSHTHALGVRATIEHVDGRNTVLVHESLNWDEPPLTQLDPPLVFDGTGSLRLRCYYENDTGRDVHFGTSATDEMCFMWLYYY